MATRLELTCESYARALELAKTDPAIAELVRDVEETTRRAQIARMDWQSFVEAEQDADHALETAMQGKE